MSLSPFNIAQRKTHIGASEAPALLGLVGSAADVIAEKLLDVEPRKATPLMDLGNLFEEGMLKFFSRETGKRYIRQQRRVADNGIISATFDGLVKPDKKGEPVREAVQAKTTCMTGFGDTSAWGEPGTGEVPAEKLAQIYTEQSVIPTIERTWVPVFLGSRGLNLYVVERDDDRIRLIVARLLEIHERHIVNREPMPEGNVPSLDLLKRLRREPSVVVPVAVDLVDAFDRTNKARLAAEKEEDVAKARLIAALVDADGKPVEGGTTPDGRTVTFLETTRKGYEVKPSVYRTLKIKEAKAPCLTSK